MLSMGMLLVAEKSRIWFVFEGSITRHDAVYSFDVDLFRLPVCQASLVLLEFTTLLPASDELTRKPMTDNAISVSGIASTCCTPDSFAYYTCIYACSLVPTLTRLLWQERRKSRDVM